MTAPNLQINSKQKSAVSNFISNSLTEKEYVFLSQISNDDSGSSKYSGAVTDFLFCDYDATDLIYITKFSVCGYALSMLSEPMGEFPSYSCRRHRLLVRVVRFLSPGDPLSDAVWRLFSLCSVMQEGKHDEADLPREIRDLVAVDFGFALLLYKIAVAREWRARHILFSTLIECLNEALDTFSVKYNAFDVLHSHVGTVLSNMIGLLLDIRLMRGEWTDRQKLFNIVNRSLELFPKINRSGIISHASRIAVVCDLAAEIATKIVSLESRRRTIVLTMPAWGEPYVNQATIGISQLRESWLRHDRSFWDRALVVLICRPDDAHQAEAVCRELSIPGQFVVSFCPTPEQVLSLNKNYLMPTLTMAGLIACKENRTDFFPLGSDSIFGPTIFDCISDLLDRRGFKVIFEPGNTFSPDILLNNTAGANDLDIPKLGVSLGGRLQSYRLSFINNIHNISNPSKIMIYDNCKFFYMNSPNCAVLSREALEDMTLPHWYTLDCWPHDLLSYLGIVSGSDCFVKSLDQFPYGTIDAGPADIEPDEHQLALLSDFGPKEDTFRLFRETRKAHRFTPIHCRAGHEVAVVGEPSDQDLAVWQVEHAVYILAMELVELEAVERTFWGVPYGDAVAAAHGIGKLDSLEDPRS